jgi:hypothetical protein
MRDRSFTVCRALTILALCLAIWEGLAVPAHADDEMNVNLCRSVLARLYCKKTSEFSYVGKLQDGVYVIGVFYASKPSEFLCAVMPDGQLIVQDRTWRAMRRVIPFSVDADGRCMSAQASSPDCPVRKPVKVCRPKTAQDKQEQARETFWSRPIPKLLEEEYKSMSGQAQQNATPPAETAPAQEGAK